MKYFSLFMFVILVTGTNAVILTKKQISQICDFKYKAPVSALSGTGRSLDEEIYCFINRKQKYIIGVFKDCQPGKKVVKKPNISTFDTCTQDTKVYDEPLYRSFVDRCDRKLSVYGTVKCNSKNTYVTTTSYYKDSTSKCKYVVESFKKRYRCSTLA